MDSGLNETPKKGTPKTDSYGSRNFVLVCLSGFSSSMGAHMVNPGLPLYLAAMGGTEAEIGAVLALRSLVALLCRPLAGWMADRGWTGRMILFAAFNTFATGILYLVTRRVWLVGTVEALRGVGLAAFSTANNIAVADLSPESRRGEAIGVYNVFISVAMAFGPAVGVALLNRGGFSTLFVASAILGLMSFALGMGIKLPVSRLAESASLRLFSKEAIPPSVALATIGFAVAPLYGFVPLYAERFGAGDTSLFFAAFAASMALIRFASGRLSDTLGRSFVVIPGLLATGFASIYLATYPVDAGLVLAGALIGAGIGAAQPALIALAVDLVPPCDRGVGVATAMAAFDAGFTAAMLVDGVVAQVMGFRAMFLMDAAVPLLGLLAFVALSKTTRPKGSFVEIGTKS